MIYALGLLLCAAIGSREAFADDGPKQPPETILIRDCVLDYERSTQVGAINAGTAGGGGGSVLQECLVRLGDRVKADQVLGRLQNRDLLAQMKKTKAEADNLLDIQIKENLHAQAALKVKQLEPLVGKNFMSRLDYSLLQLTEKEALIEIDKAKFTRSLADLQYQQIAAEFRNRDFRTPHDGVVVEIFRHEGERIMTGDSVFLVVDDNHLLVTGQVDVADAWRAHKGQRVRVTPDVEGAELPIESEDFEGEVIFVDNRIDPSTRTCKVIARIANRDGLLRSGLAARMELHLADQPPKPPDGPAPARVGRIGD